MVSRKNRIIFDAPEMAVEFLVLRWIFLETNIIRFVGQLSMFCFHPGMKNITTTGFQHVAREILQVIILWGVDSTAAMCLMPNNTRLLYLERNFDSMIKHENAHRFIDLLKKEGREVITIKSNHEKIRTFYNKNPGFSTDYACMAHLILVADFFDLDASGTGMPLENAYFFHGSQVRNFKETSFWQKYSPMFAYLGIPIYQPVAGCSEIANNTIVNENGYKDMQLRVFDRVLQGRPATDVGNALEKIPSTV